MKLSEKARRLREEYKNKYKEQPKGWEYDKETMQEYEEYLEKELTKL